MRRTWHLILSSILLIGLAAAPRANDPVSDSVERDKEAELAEEIQCPLEDAAVSAAQGIVGTLLAATDDTTALPNLGTVYPDGTFTITDWTDYPDLGAPRPDGPFRLLPADEQEVARKAANASNRKLRGSDPAKYKGKEIHEINPVKHGGSPTDLNNKVVLSPEAHRKYTTWWNRVQRWAECRVKKVRGKK
jgi:hypothetical protein